MCIIVFAKELFTQLNAMDKTNTLCKEKIHRQDESLRGWKRSNYCAFFEKTGRVQCPANTGRLPRLPLRMKKRKGWSTAKLIEGGGT